jgi:hypothetical protein
MAGASHLKIENGLKFRLDSGKPTKQSIMVNIARAAPSTVHRFSTETILHSAYGLN